MPFKFLFKGLVHPNYIYRHTHTHYGSQWDPSTVWLPIFFKISSFLFNGRKKLIQGWINLRVS